MSLFLMHGLLCRNFVFYEEMHTDCNPLFHFPEKPDFLHTFLPKNTGDNNRTGS